MSGRRAKNKRQAEREASAFNSPTAYARRCADAALKVDLSDVPATSVSQFAIGWMRAALAKSYTISALTDAGLGYAAAPNRRAFWELAIRMLWLSGKPRDERHTLAHTMLEHDRRNESKTHKYLVDNGLPSDIDVEAMEAIFLEASRDVAEREEAGKVTRAVKSSTTNLWPIFRLWRDDSMWSHATGFLAGQYAPAGDRDVFGVGQPPHRDIQMTAHRMAAMVLLTAVGDLLKDEGAPLRVASAPFSAYVSAE